MSIEVITLGVFYYGIKYILDIITLIKKFIERKRKKSATIEDPNEIAVINLSGRPLSDQTVNEIKKWDNVKIISKPVLSIDLTNPNTYMENILIFCSKTIKELIKKDKVLKHILLGKYILIPPGLSSISMVFKTLFHGITGRFPNTLFFYKSGMTYNLIKPFDFQALRNKYLSIEKPETNEKEFAVINLSGRFLSKEAKNDINNWGKCTIVEKQIPNVDLSNPNMYIENIIIFCDKIIKDLIKRDLLTQNLIVGTYSMIPHGMNAIAMVFCAILHGITGQFPIMSFFYKSGIHFSVTKPFDFHDLRMQFRNIN